MICFRWVDISLEAHEEFIGLHEVELTLAAVLHSVVSDILLRLNISVSNLLGQCYDGATAKPRSRNGLAKLTNESE